MTDTTCRGSTSQPLEALAVANHNRILAAELLREVRSGVLPIADAVYDERAGCITILRLLASQHRWGRARALKVLRNVPVTETVRVRDLTDRQRAAVARIVSAPGPTASVDCNPCAETSAESAGGDRRW
jgi:hypothetical protein